MKNLNGILSRLDENDFNVFNSVPEEERRELKNGSSWLLPQIMTGAKNEMDHEYLVLAFNEFCNDKWSDLSDFTELRMKLLSAIGTGRRTYHQFFKPMKGKAKMNELTAFLREEYPDIKDDEISLFCFETGVEELVDLLCKAGVAIEEQKKIIKQYEARKS